MPEQTGTPQEEIQREEPPSSFAWNTYKKLWNGTKRLGHTLEYKAHVALKRPLFLVVMGVVLYSLSAFAVGQWASPDQGSTAKLLCQQWSRPEYFHGRPSWFGDAAVSHPAGGPAQGKAQRHCVPGRSFGVSTYAEQFRLENGLAPNVVLPADIVTASGNRVDPEISFTAASLQINRIVAARWAVGRTHAVIAAEKVGALLVKDLHEPGLGETSVDVLTLNRALDMSFGTP